MSEGRDTQAFSQWRARSKIQLAFKTRAHEPGGWATERTSVMVEHIASQLAPIQIREATPATSGRPTTRYRAWGSTVQWTRIGAMPPSRRSTAPGRRAQTSKSFHGSSCVPDGKQCPNEPMTSRSTQGASWPRKRRVYADWARCFRRASKAGWPTERACTRIKSIDVGSSATRVPEIATCENPAKALKQDAENAARRLTTKRQMRRRERPRRASAPAGWISE